MKRPACPSLILLVAPLLVTGLAAAGPGTPAVPGGGNPQGNNPHSASLAIPGGRTDQGTGGLRRDESQDSSGSNGRGNAAPSSGDVRMLQARETGDLLEMHADVRNQVRGRWQGFRPADRAAFLRVHPTWRVSMFGFSWERLTVEQRGEFVMFYPEFFPVLQTRWDGMSVRERSRFSGWHPGMDDRMHGRHGKHRRDRDERSGDRDDRRERRDGRDERR